MYEGRLYYINILILRISENGLSDYSHFSKIQRRKIKMKVERTIVIKRK